MIDREKLEAALFVYSKFDTNYGLSAECTIIDAAREYAKILPHLEKMVCARKLAHGGNWRSIKIEDYYIGGWAARSDTKVFWLGPAAMEDKDDCDFVVTAANEISALMKEIGDE